MPNEQSGQKAQEIQGRTKFGQLLDASETDTDFRRIFSLSEANMLNVHGFMGQLPCSQEKGYLIMQKLPYLKRLTLGKSASYCIKVQGRLDETWSDRLAGMQIKTNSRGDINETILSGYVRDQAELLGVLNSLYELHLPLLSLEILNKE
ncbi:MAG: hypothetical protein SRB2_02887 [Desulfobacteraceae bacterium Eth-SRB2]|nr:MAG: hypothetical protein SRB2_02887 [Desulfobacteraceae bacterium Eth-SRB2]